MATATSDSQLSGQSHRTTDMESPKAHRTRSRGSGSFPLSRRSRRRAAAMSAWDARSVKNSAAFGGYLFGHRRRHELIDTGAVSLTDFCDDCLQRCRQPQRIGAEQFLHDKRLLKASWGESNAMPNRPVTWPSPSFLSTQPVSSCPSFNPPLIVS